MASPPPPPLSEPRLPLRIVYFGTPELAAYILERLVVAAGEDFEVVGVVTRPDRPRKRGMNLEPSEVGAIAERFGLPTLKPVKLRGPEFLSDLKVFSPDLLVIAAYGRILPNPVLEAASLMPINVHASLLPKFRGASPAEGAILAGESESGVTIMRVTERMDAGPILLQRSISLAVEETQGSLKQKLAKLGAEALLEALTRLKQAKLVETPQNDNLATYTSPIVKEHAVIDWGAEATYIERMVRAYNPWPVARTQLGGEELLIWRARPVPENERGATAESGDSYPGTIVSVKPNPIIKCGEGVLELLEVQAPGRRRMPAADFARGRRISPGTRLGG